jgi:hypothetical protein
LVTLTAVSMQAPPQRVFASGQMQFPLTQSEAGAVHGFPQSPQFAGSLRVLAQTGPGQILLWPVGPQTQWPAVQPTSLRPAPRTVQSLSQPPQWWTSLFTSAQPAPQVAKPARHWQAPSTQAAPASQGGMQPWAPVVVPPVVVLPLEVPPLLLPPALVAAEALAPELVPAALADAPDEVPPLEVAPDAPDPLAEAPAGLPPAELAAEPEEAPESSSMPDTVVS